MHYLKEHYIQEFPENHIKSLKRMSQFKRILRRYVYIGLDLKL